VTFSRLFCGYYLFIAIIFTLIRFLCMFDSRHSVLLLHVSDLITCLCLKLQPGRLICWKNSVMVLNLHFSMEVCGSVFYQAHPTDLQLLIMFLHTSIGSVVLKINSTSLAPILAFWWVSHEFIHQLRCNRISKL
jgi:hypothetical protein